MALKKNVSRKSYYNCRLFNESMHLLCPEGIKYDYILLFITDAALYMNEAAEILCVSYPKLILVDCACVLCTEYVILCNPCILMWQTGIEWKESVC